MLSDLKKYSAHFAAAAGLGLALSATMTLAQPAIPSLPAERYEEEVGVFVQADACLATGAHSASVAVSFLYNVMDYVRLYPAEASQLDRAMADRAQDVMKSQENPRPPARIMAEMRARFETRLAPALGESGESFWNDAAAAALAPLPPSMPFTSAFRDALKRKGGDYEQTLTEKNNVLPILIQMDNSWHKKRRNVFSMGDERIMKDLADAFEPVLKETIARFYPDDADALVDEAFGNVLRDTALYTRGSNLFRAALMKNMPDAGADAQASVRHLDTAWYRALKENTPMDRAELNNYMADLRTDMTNEAIRAHIPDRKMVETFAVLWAREAAALTPADMEAETVQESPRLHDAFTDVIRSLQAVVKERTGFSIVATRAAHVPAKPGCLAPGGGG